MPYQLRAIIVSLACSLYTMTAGIAAGDRLNLEDTSLSRAETEVLVKKDLAQRLKVPVDQLKLVRASDRTWSDANLGCSARKGLVEPIPIQGFAFTFTYGGKQYVYHSDREGHFRRCDAAKPIAPITR
jgi:hypothetical protein